MAPARKADPPRPYDVPAPLAAGVGVLLAAVFLPMNLRGPAWPSGLPPVAYDPQAIAAEHRAGLNLDVPAASPAVMAAWRELNRALGRRDTPGSAQAQGDFSRLTIRATQHARPAWRALRARACEAFVTPPTRGDRDPTGIVPIATRHRVVGPRAGASVDRAQRLAWCYLRWERLALPTPDQGSVEPLMDTLLRVPAPLQRGFVRWALGASCAALVGLDGRALTLDDPRRCAAYRRELLPAAVGLDPGYPAAEARAHTEMLLGLGLSHAVATVGHEGPSGPAGEFARSTAQHDARQAFQAASDAYGSLLRRAPSYRTERLALGALRALADE